MKHQMQLPWVLEDNFCPRRAQVAENLMKAYSDTLAAQGMETTAKERYDFSMGAYIGLMVMEGMLKGTESETLKQLIQKVTRL